MTLKIPRGTEKHAEDEREDDRDDDDDDEKKRDTYGHGTGVKGKKMNTVKDLIQKKAADETDDKKPSLARGAAVGAGLNYASGHAIGEAERRIARSGGQEGMNNAAAYLEDFGREHPSLGGPETHIGRRAKLLREGLPAKGFHASIVRRAPWMLAGGAGVGLGVQAIRRHNYNKRHAAEKQAADAAPSDRYRDTQLAATLVPGVGALRAPKGQRLHGLVRGELGGLAGGAGGALAGGLGGAGLGALIGKLVKNPAEGAQIGGVLGYGTGGVAGAGYGRHKATEKYVHHGKHVKKHATAVDLLKDAADAAPPTQPPNMKDLAQGAPAVIQPLAPVTPPPFKPQMGHGKGVEKKGADIGSAIGGVYDNARRMASAKPSGMAGVPTGQAVADSVEKVKTDARSNIAASASTKGPQVAAAPPTSPPPFQAPAPADKMPGLANMANSFGKAKTDAMSRPQFASGTPPMSKAGSAFTKMANRSDGMFFGKGVGRDDGMFFKHANEDDGTPSMDSMDAAAVDGHGKGVKGRAEKKVEARSL